MDEDETKAKIRVYDAMANKLVKEGTATLLFSIGKVIMPNGLVSSDAEIPKMTPPKPPELPKIEDVTDKKDDVKQIEGGKKEEPKKDESKK